MKPGLSIQLSPRRPSAYTVAEVLVAVFLLGIITVSLFAAFSSGLAIVSLARENLRATQVLTEKLETIRLLTWEQGTNQTLASPAFTEPYDPASDNPGVIYSGFVSVGPAPGVPADYQDNLRLVTVTVYWTNYLQGSTIPIVHSRQMQTCVARYGMQNYLYP